MGYYASDVPRLRTGSIVSPPPKPRASAPYGDGISATGYGSTTRTLKHGGPMTGNGWTPSLLRDVEERYARKASARKARTRSARPTVESVEARNARERAIIGSIGSAD